jgi:hypothetical protein
VVSNGSPITVRFEEVDTDGAGPDDQRNVTLNGFTLVEGAVPQQPRFLQYAIDIGTSESATEPGFTALNAELGEVSVGQTSFAVFSADGARNRAGANALTTDFVFDDGDGGAVGVQVFDLPDGVWQAEVWAWDDSVAMGDMIVGITQFQHAPEMIFTDSFTPDPNQPFTFTFDSRDLIDGFGIFTRENNDPLFRSRFNALRLTQIIPEPATASLLALGAVVLLRRRRRVA